MLNESRIRQIIREELRRQVDEMAYAGHLGWRRSGKPDEESFFSDQTMNGNPDGAEWFARSKKFKSLAQKHLAHIPGNVWIASIIGVDAGVSDVPDDENRVRIEPLLPDGMETLKNLKFRLLNRVGSGDTVILYTSNLVVREFLATPWIIFHSMFDSGDSAERICPSFAKLRDALVDQRADEFPEFKAIMDYDAEWSWALTMASGRRGHISTINDALAEIMCQELLTSGGFEVNYEWADGDVVDALDALKPHIKRCADEFRQRIKGKLIMVAVN